jgi:hypothetical protein
MLMLLLAGAGRMADAQLPGEAVVRAAYRSSGAKWFHTAHWVQRTTLRDDGRVETWYVTLQPPGMLRVDVAPGVTGRLLLSRNDSTYNFGKGRLRSAAPDVQPLFVLLHDLHSARPEKTIKMLHDYGFDLSKTHEQDWDGVRVIVVGAAAGDSTSDQFWLEKRRMVLVRLIERNGADPRRPLDARIGNYEKAGSGWLEQSVALYLGGQLSTLEEYSDVKVDAALEPGIFTPLPYRLPQWVHGAPDIFGNVPNMALPGGH